MEKSRRGRKRSRPVTLRAQKNWKEGGLVVLGAARSLLQWTESKKKRVWILKGITYRVRMTTGTKKKRAKKGGGADVGVHVSGASNVLTRL